MVKKKQDPNRNREITRENLETKDAFEYYYYLGKDRTLEKVSEKFGKELITVKNWSRLFGWKLRIAGWDDKLSKMVEENNRDRKTKTINDNLDTIAALINIFRKDILEGIIKPESVKDFETLVKLQQLLTDNPTDRNETKYILERGTIVSNK